VHTLKRLTPSFSDFMISFVMLYVSVLFYRKAGGGGAGSLDSATKAEKAAHRKWERACDKATEQARAIINAPALTLEAC
jgi:hypothetical protein